MIYIRLLSNLGNQMFQYAAGRLAAERLNCPFALSEGRLPWRDVPRVRQSTALFNHFPSLPAGVEGGYLSRYLDLRALLATEFRPWSPGAAPRVGLEGYHPGYRQLKTFTRLIGYFQSPLYLQGGEAKVRDWFSMSSDERADTERRWRQIGIDPAEAVAVHVRLGDYRQQTAIGANQEDGWILPREYYQKALEIAGSSRPVVLFSDEPELAEAYLGRKADHVSRTLDSRVDFCMMSSCARLIIANSTYSWWAAWLNTNPSALIVAPEFFLGRNVGIWYPKDIRVDGWHYV